MDADIKQQLNTLRLPKLAETWSQVLAMANRQKVSYQRFLEDIIREEYQHLQENRRLARLKAAKIPERLPMETFPFEAQPKLRKKMVMGMYDSLDYIQQAQVLCLIGPTGCGKTGLATAYLMNALDKGYRGRFIDFRELVRLLHQSQADYSQHKILRHLAAYDCLLIDELGYCPMAKDEAGMFFDLMKQRHRKKCTIITTQLGFDEWNGFLNNKHLTMALVDRITENCTVFDMQKCISIRKKNIKLAAE